ncbi:MAG: branched-chain amino acid ABC transporter permease [Truepera sp.]|jgi:branched-chain amino acid transport system permease protein|nr:branched-chain amino acid ABC transporter permease [Truepera sp.]HRN18760.1 branched-chain amino acid ABC transporter permease [Trueperaceae bacterium]HRQ10811.1 branched-chain amino acid ABC transporter permease [Trueperaceae bacterium]
MKPPLDGAPPVPAPAAYVPHYTKRRTRNTLLTLGGLALTVLVLLLVDGGTSSKLKQVFALFAIWGIATVSLNLVNGVTGILSLGHHGFMLVGGYTTGLLILPAATRETLASSARSNLSDFSIGLSVENMLRGVGLDALTTPETLWARFLIALFIGGIMAALFGVIVGFPSLRLRGDYLAIVTFAFGEAIRLLASTPMMSSFTNGALGFAGVPSSFGKSVWWTFGLLAITIFVMARLKYSSYGRVLQGIREDEIASEAMGVNTSYHKVLAFAISAFFAGVAGGLWVSWVGTARLDLFLFFLTFYFLVAISVGGTGSITGVLLGTALVVWVRQYGDPLEQSYPLSTWVVAAGAVLVALAVIAYIIRRTRRLRPQLNPLVYVPALLGVGLALFGLYGSDLASLQTRWQGFGMRAITLSVVLIAIMILRPSGIMGRREFSWAWLFRERLDEPTEEEKRQDAWLSNPALAGKQEDADDNEEVKP